MHKKIIITSVAAIAFTALNAMENPHLPRTPSLFDDCSTEGQECTAASFTAANFLAKNCGAGESDPTDNSTTLGQTESTINFLRDPGAETREVSNPTGDNNSVSMDTIFEPGHSDYTGAAAAAASTQEDHYPQPLKRLGAYRISANPTPASTAMALAFSKKYLNQQRPPLGVENDVSHQSGAAPLPVDCVESPSLKRTQMSFSRVPESITPPHAPGTPFSRGGSTFGDFLQTVPGSGATSTTSSRDVSVVRTVPGSEATPTTSSRDVSVGGNSFP
ncbi:MAG: hypothetical protein HEEMFOPI_00785 [Holosporales bacterium]